MSNIEMQLISRVIHAGDLHTVLEWGVTVDDFRTSEGKGLFNIITSYYCNEASKMSVLGPNLFHHLSPSVQLVADNNVHTELLCSELRAARLKAEAKERATELLNNIDLTPQEAVSEMHEAMTHLLALGITKNSDLSMSASLKKTWQKYQYMKVHGAASMAKLLWPWGELNDLSGGIQSDDYVVLYGRPKSMKTWAMSVILAWAFQQEKRVLLYTKEMTQDNIYMRAISAILRIPYQEFRSAKLGPAEEEMLSQLIEFAENCGFDPICLSGRDAKGGDNIAWLRAKVEKYKPDVVFVDGMYLLSSTVSKKAAQWERITEISRGIRDTILATETPFICTMQANRGAAKHGAANLDEIAYADAIGQDATVLIRVINEKVIQPHIGVPTIALVFGGSREFSLHGLRIGATPSTDFEFKEVMTEKDILKASENDVGEAEREDPTAHAKARKKATKANGAATPSAADAQVQALVDAQVGAIGMSV